MRFARSPSRRLPKVVFRGGFPAGEGCGNGGWRATARRLSYSLTFVT